MEPPYTAVIFSSQRTDADADGYDATTAEMERLAATQPGYLGIESARGADGFGITVSYWRSEGDARRVEGRRRAPPRAAGGPSALVLLVRARVATVRRAYGFDGGGFDGRGGASA